ncbi:hypothetical protein MTP10_22775 [Nonomuraea sp. 3-1Str]|uniref:hypothetical protein n=1 Tax=Nonomuraea sp. 3-1Str TaxID=2929801 RepID=UPI002864C482|nr:hypothetical protein [Nonomuraea sp. 3-1Str]MDR8411549.1 hypothetical protein [Nonomuraea sp. 3-1Str]
MTVASSAPRPSNPSDAVNASWPETPRQDGPAGRHDGMRDGGRGGSREPVHRDPVPAWQDPSSTPSSPSNAWSNLSSPAPWPPADSAPARPSSADAMDRTMMYGTGTPLNDHAVPQGPHSARPDDRSHDRPHDRPVPQGSYGDGMPLDERAAAQGRERARPGGDRPGPGHPANAHPGAGHPPPGPGPAGRDAAGHAQPAPGHAYPAEVRQPGHPGQPGHPDQPGPPGQHGQPGPPGQHGQHGHPGEHDQQGHPDEPGQPRPGSNLSRDPSDPDRPFVTAGQISGSRTPPPDRQQELWNNVFGDEYEGMGEPDSLDEPGKPIWIYALAGSVSIALVGALLWAFLAGPLAGDKETPAAADTSKPSASSTPRTTRSSTSIGRLKTYPGKAAPVVGTVSDTTAGLSVPRLGGTWQLDQRGTVRGTYGFATRQYVRTGTDTYAQILTGPLPTAMASSFTSEKDLEPAIKSVVVNARKRFFPEGNTVRKIAQQPLKVGNSTGQLIAYSLTSATGNATIVTAAVNTGKDVPAIVYMSVPATGKQLLPDVNTVVRQLKVISQ